MSGHYTGPDRNTSQNMLNEFHHQQQRAQFHLAQQQNMLASPEGSRVQDTSSFGRKANDNNTTMMPFFGTGGLTPEYPGMFNIPSGTATGPLFSVKTPNVQNNADVGFVKREQQEEQFSLTPNSEVINGSTQQPHRMSMSSSVDNTSETFAASSIGLDNSMDDPSLVKSQFLAPSIGTNAASVGSYYSNGEQPNGDDPNMSKARKKAQNRAAQKAFRERKEARLKELEQKVMESENDRSVLVKELEELRKLNLEINAENRVLLKKKGGASIEHITSASIDHRFSFPTDKEFYEKFGKNLKSDWIDESGGELLTVPQTWEYLNQLCESVEFDVTSVMHILKGQEICHYNGPAYPKSLIDLLVQTVINNQVNDPH